MRSRRVLRVAAPLMVALSLAACGPHRSTTIGLRSTPLDLQFARPDLAKPVPPVVVVRLLPAPPLSLQHILVPGLPVPPPQPPPPVPAKCDTKIRVLGKPLAQSTLGSPRSGFYTYDTKGKGTVTGGVAAISAPIPRDTTVAITEPTKETPSQTIAAEGGAPASGKVTQYTVTTALAPNVRQVDVLAVSATSLNLVKRTLVDGARSFDFVPTPQVQLMKFGPVGTTWTSRGVDSNSGAAMDYSGSIDAITEGLACGYVNKGYVVTYQSTLTNPTGNEIIRTGTDSAHPSAFVIAPQLGGLILAQRVYTDDIRLMSDLSGYVETTLDYTSLITDTDPSRQ